MTALATVSCALVHSCLNTHTHSTGVQSDPACSLSTLLTTHTYILLAQPHIQLPKHAHSPPLAE